LKGICLSEYYGHQSAAYMGVKEVRGSFRGVHEARQRRGVFNQRHDRSAASAYNDVLGVWSVIGL